MAYKKQKNLVGNRNQYNKYYGDFRGVDFTSDHTRVHDQRFSYAVNMYKDYQSAQGHAIETIPGFREIESYSEKIYGIHRFKYEDETGQKKQRIIVHTGGSLQLFHHQNTSTSLLPGTGIEMNAHKSTSFVFNNRLYILDGKNFLYYDGNEVKKVSDNPYIPTPYLSGETRGDAYHIGVEYEQRNLLSDYYYESFIIKDVTDNGALFPANKYFYADWSLGMGNLLVEEVYVDGETVTEESVSNFEEISASETPVRFIRLKVSDTYQPEIRIAFKDKPVKNVEVKLKIKRKILQVSGVVESITGTESSSSIIEGCTIAAVYDNRVFLSGNPSYPRHVFYCGINSQTGYTDPSYWGILNYFQEGVGMSPVTALMPVADSLLVLKGDTQQDGSVYYHTRQETGKDVLPVVYPSTPGLNGTGCLGAAINFLDDPVFISKYGLEGIGQLSVRYERAIEHRSYLIDSMLLNMGQDKLKNACLEEWNGYLLLLVDGKIFMADSRQRYSHETGIMQYEWYYLEDIGVYKDQKKIYIYTQATTLSDELSGEGVEIDENRKGQIVPSDVTIKYIDTMDGGYELHGYYVEENEKKYCVEPTGESIGGTYSPAVTIREIDGNIYFGTKDGHLCCFNFDKRTTDTFEIPTQWYTFNGRRIISGCATKMDCCDVPHLTKSTVSRSTVIKTKALNRTAAKVAVRTNKNPFNQIARINSGKFDFDDIDFGDFTFEKTLFALKENEKQWVEKQYYIYSDEFQSPFALFYISYRYMIAGRIKE